MARVLAPGTRASVAKQSARQWNAIHSIAAKHRRAKAIERGEIEGIFEPFSKRLTDDTRAMIEAAINAGMARVIQRGVSGLEV